MSHTAPERSGFPAAGTILIVDDSKTARVIARRCLEIAGFGQAGFLEAENGETALAIVRSTRVDLVLTDINMPHMDGRTFLRHVRASPKLNSLPVIVISSVAGAESAAPAFGAQAVVSKPLTPALLAPVVWALFEGSGRGGCGYGN